METTLRPLGLAMQAVAELGLEVTYAYDDLLFVAHNAFLLQFHETDSGLDLHFNQDCPEVEAEIITSKLQNIAKNLGISITRKGRYQLGQKDKESMSLHFL